MEHEPDDRPEELLAGHVEWVRALARRLAGDAESADDLAQDALVVALRSPPRESLAFRPWIASVMRNLVRQGARGDARRDAREERAARPESGDRLVEEVVAGRELAQAVLDLPEPYRTALLMRFYENAPPREIARRLDVPVATVNSRLARGLAQLRERYDRGGSTGGAGLAALTPLIVPPPAHGAQVMPALSIGGLVVNAKLVLSAAAALVVAAVLWGITSSTSNDAGAQHPIASVAPRAANGRPDVPLASDERAGGTARAASELVPEEIAAEAPAAPAPEDVHVVSGDLLDADGLPLGGLVVGASAHSASAKAGRFRLETRAENLALSVLDEGWVTVREGTWSARSALEPVVVATRALEVEGVVVDARGDPIQDARVQLAMPSAFPARFATSLESSRSLAFGTTTDAEGRFRFAALPRIEGARLRAVREGWRTADVAAPVDADRSVRLVMSRPEIPLAGAVRGVVVDPHGVPVGEARVFLGLASTTTDERGRFGLDLARAVTADRITAVKAAMTPAFLERPREPQGADTGWPDEVELVLGGETLVIAGIVRDHEGRPKPGVRISIADPTAVGTIGRMPATAEGLASGAPVPPAAVESESDLPARDADHFNDMTMRVPPPTAFWNYATSGADGRFEIGGLLGRRYKLCVQDPRTLQAHTTAAFEAGDTSADIRLPAPNAWPELAGTLVDDAGEPLAGVRVDVDAEAYGVRARFFGGRVYVSLRDQGGRAVSDEHGRFVLHDVPRVGATLQISAEGIVPKSFELSGDLDPKDVEIEVATRCSFEVRIAAGEEPAPDAISLLDARGDPIDVLRIESGSVNAWTSAPLSDGRTGVLSASSAARSLVLLKDDRVLRSVPIRLRTGETNRIEL